MKRSIVVGVIAGWAVWGTLCALFYAMQEWSYVLPSWMTDGSAFGFIGAGVAIAWAPVTMGGWFFLWGDNGPPYPWIDSWGFIVTFGMTFYGILGALAGMLFSQRGRGNHVAESAGKL
jgi:hypothetical protein